MGDHEELLGEMLDQSMKWLCLAKTNKTANTVMLENVKGIDDAFNHLPKSTEEARNLVNELSDEFSY